MADVPVTTTSPAGRIHGNTVDQDEILGVTLISGVHPLAVINTYPIADELTLHQSLAPNPDSSDQDDDDVDSLNAIGDTEPGAELVDERRPRSKAVVRPRRHL